MLIPYLVLRSLPFLALPIPGCRRRWSSTALAHLHSPFKKSFI